MSRFRVEVVEQVSVYEVEAFDEDEAVGLANDGLTLQAEVRAEWKVIDVNKVW